MKRTYGLTELVGTSPESIEDAIATAIERSSAEVRHIDWFEVTQIRGYVRDDKVNHFQVSIKVGYRMEDA